MKKIVCLISMILIVATLFASCAGGGKTYDDTTVEDTTTGAVEEEKRPQHPIMDLINNKTLGQYVTLGDYSKLEVSYNVAVSDETVEKELADYAKEYKYSTLITDRVTAKGDTLEINFAGKIDGVAFEGGTAEKQTISLTENTGYIDGFDKDLYGVMPGTTVETTVKFPENYGKEELNGKEAVFTITVNGICKYEFTDETVAKLTNDEHKTVASFREYIRKSMILENLKNYENTVNSKIIEALEDASEIILVPEQQVNYYYYDMMYYYEDYYKSNAAMLQLYYGIADLKSFLEASGITEKDVMDAAKIYAIEDLLLIACAQKMGLEVSDSDYINGVKKYVEEWGFNTADELIDAYGETYIRQSILKAECLEELRKLTKVTSDYDEYKHLLDEAENTTAGTTTESSPEDTSNPADVTTSASDEATTPADNTDNTTVPVN